MACVRWVCSEYQGLLSSGDPAVLVLGELFVDAVGELETANLLDAVEQQELPVHRVVREVVEHAFERVVVLRLLRRQRALEFAKIPSFYRGAISTRMYGRHHVKKEEEKRKSTERARF